ncbi:MAG: ornithine cyclodeaminase, partial [Pseudomonadota bacterium]
MTVETIGQDAERFLDWQGLTQAIEAGHRLPKAEIKDIFLYRRDDTLLDRAAWIDGLGSLVKIGTIVPGNTARGVPTINGIVNLFDDVTG